MSERHSAQRSLRAASIGRCSQTRTPADRVEIAAKSPRMSSGPSGLGSKLSCCARPPERKMKMTARDGEADAPAAVRSRASSPRPSMPIDPARTASRRFRRGLRSPRGEGGSQGMTLLRARGQGAASRGTSSKNDPSSPFPTEPTPHDRPTKRDHRARSTSCSLRFPPGARPAQARAEHHDGSSPVSSTTPADRIAPVAAAREP